MRGSLPVRRVMADLELQRTMSVAARDYALSMSWDSVFEKVYCAYRFCLARQPEKGLDRPAMPSSRWRKLVFREKIRVIRMVRPSPAIPLALQPILLGESRSGDRLRRSPGEYFGH